MPMAKRVISMHNRISLSYITHTRRILVTIDNKEIKKQKEVNIKAEVPLIYSKHSRDGCESCNGMHRERLAFNRKPNPFPSSTREHSSKSGQPGKLGT